VTNYTTNIAQNPGFQLGLTGYSAVNNASLTLGTIKGTGALLGNPGTFVDTPGVMAGEGIMTYDSTLLGGFGNIYSFSVYILGLSAGSVTVYAVANPGGVILGSAPVQLTSSYQRVTINNVNIGSSTDLYLIVSTTSAQSVEFWITNVQIEPETPAQPYCDGNQPGCAWTGGVFGGTSFQQYQNTIVATSNNVNSSGVVKVLIQGAAFNITIKGGQNHNYSSIVRTSFTVGPVGAMTDFSVAALTDIDPVQTYTGWNNAGVTVPTSGYVRSWATFFPPQDYFVSNNSQLYSRGAFMAAGWQFSNVPNNAKVTVSDVQVEVLPMITGFAAPSPTTYVLPREIQTIIKPDRLNYCPNPSFNVSLAGWNPVGTAVLTLDPAVYVHSSFFIDENPEPAVGDSMNVATTNSGDGASIQLTNLIAGDTYIVSAYVQVNANINNILLTCANGSTSVQHGNAGTGYGQGPYGGSSYYGGNPPVNTALPTGQWFRIYTTFQPTDSVATLLITAATTAATEFWIDDVLVEAGEVLSFYFDGSFGSNYFWETGGTPGLSRSYYYDQFFTKSAAVTNVLQHHTPLGISYVAPLFSVPPTQ
jgi:hypothetical protein